MTAVIGGKENDRVLIQIEAFERVQQSPERFVEAFDGAEVAAKVLIGGAIQSGKIMRDPPVGVTFAITVGRDIVIDIVLVVRFEE